MTPLPNRAAAAPESPQRVAGLALAVVLLATALFAAAGRAAETHPLLENGFDPEQVYDLGNIDHVNLLNGNLMVTLPLGPRYPIREGFSYGFNLVYNSQIWAYTTCPGEDFPCDVDPTDPLTVDGNGATVGHNQGYPNPRNNAGAGWRVTTTFGELYGPTVLDVGDKRKTGFTYVDASGETRGFRIKASVSNTAGSQFVYPRYSFDGADTLRLAIPSNGWNAAGEPILAEIHRSDGVVILFSRPSAAEEPQAPRGRWHLVEVRDPFGSGADLSFDEQMQAITIINQDTGSPMTIYVPSLWTVTDHHHGRTHSVTFDTDGRVLQVDLPGFGAARSTFDFAYAPPVGVIPGCPHDNAGAGGESAPENLVHLEKVTLPDTTSTYAFSYKPPGTDGNLFCTHNDGRLASVMLPTKGEIEYDYGLYTFPRGQCESVPFYQTPGQDVPFGWTRVSGVTARRLKDRYGTELGHWRYQGTLPTLWGGLYEIDWNAGTCELSDVAYTDVYEPIQGDTYKLTRHFFSVHLANDPGANAEGWTKDEYGLSLDRYSPDPYDPASGRFRSSMEFECKGDPNLYQYAVPLDVIGGDPAALLWRERRHLWVPAECGNGNNNSSGTPFADPADVHGFRDHYVRYEGGQSHLCDVVGDPCEKQDWQAASEVTYFYDDFFDHDYIASTPMRPRWVQVDRSGPDGFGNYRSEVMSSKFFDLGRQNANPTTVVQYNNYLTDLPPATAPWILDTFAYRETTVNTVTAREEFNFDTTTGFLTSRRALRSGTTHAWNDLTVTFTRDADGNTIGEQYTGGDIGGSYVVSNVFQGGVLARRDYLENANANARTILRSVDAVIDTATGLPSASWDTAGVETTYDYDALWRLKSSTPSAQGVSVEAPAVYTYTAATGATAAKVVVDRTPTLAHREIFFDDFGRPVREEIATPAGGTSLRTTGYTAQGWVEDVSTLHDSATAAAAGHTQTTYDIFGRPKRITAPDGSVTEIARQGIRREKRETSGLASVDARKTHVELWYRNASGQLIDLQQGRLVTDPNSGEATPQIELATKYFYDEGGRLEEVLQAGQKRVFLYDGAGLLFRECHPELGFDGTTCDATSVGAIHHGGHDARGNPTTKRFGSSGSPFDLQFVYDRAERLVQVRELGTGGLLEESFFTNLYGGDLPEVAACAAGEEYKCRVDRGNGKLYQTKRHNPSSNSINNVVVTETLQYAGRGGRLSRREVRSGGHSGAPRVSFDSSFAYGSLGNLSSVGYPTCVPSGCGTQVPVRGALYGYDRGLPTSVSATGLTTSTLSYHPNLTVHQIAHGNGVTDTYDRDPQLMARTAGIHIQRGVTTLWDSGSFSYDGAGNVAAIGSDVYTYDPDFLRLSTASVGYPHPTLGTATESRSFGYDVYGNLLSITGSTSRTMPADAASNRLTNGVYDLAGNLTAYGSWQYEYDSLGSMTHANDASGTNGRDFLYTAGGERVATSFNGGGRELWTIRGADNSVLRDVEYMSTGWRWVEDYVHRGSQLMASIANTEAGEVVRHHHLNHLGSPRVLTDAVGNVVGEHVYAPYGEELTEPLQDEERLKFTGHERDDLDPNGQAGDLDYMHARFYSPWTGRFASMDPVGGRVASPASWNRYTYANSSPVSVVDPDGRAGKAGQPVIRAGNGMPALENTAPKPIFERGPVLIRLVPALSVGVKVPGLVNLSVGAVVADKQYRDDYHEFTESSIGVTAQVGGVGPSIALTESTYNDRVGDNDMEELNLETSFTAGVLSTGDEPRTLVIDIGPVHIEVEDTSRPPAEVLGKMKEDNPELYERLNNLSSLKGDV